MNFFLKFWLHHSLHLFVRALPVHDPTESRELLIKLLLVLTNLAICLTRKDTLARQTPSDCEAVYLSLIHSCAWAEYHWAASIHPQYHGTTNRLA